MSDFLEGCNDQHVPVTDFMDIFCKRCRNRDCIHAGWAEDRFSVRIAGQEERFFNPERADPRLPKYAQILASEFQDMLHHAMALEISEKRGDWEIPEIPILDGNTNVGTLDQTQGVDAAVKVLATARGHTSPKLPEPSPPPAAPTEQAKPTPPVQAKPTPPAAPQTPQKMVSVVMTLPRGNTSNPAGGVMVDGSPAPAPAPKQVEADLWAIPAAKNEVKIPVGGKVVMGGEPEGT